MSLEKENNILVQKYKLAFEEHKLIKEIYDAGTRDLNAHLNIFKDLLSDDIKNQKKRFENNFFGPSDSHEKDSADTQEVEKPKKPDWAKKVYREIVLSTHPDKTQFLGVESVKNKFLNYYNLAVESYNKDEFENIIFIAADLGINLDNCDVENTVKPKLKSIIKEIERMKGTVAFEWAHIEDDKKKDLLEKHLINLGFVFKKEQIDEAIERAKRIKRKVGSRPVNYIKNRVKS